MAETPASWVSHPWVTQSQDRLRFGIVHPLLGVDLDWPQLLQRVQQADALGFDAYWFSDHPLLNPDCWTRIAALAACTRSIRLGTMVSCIYYRHPALLARIVADCDRISEGRIILGLGIGDFVPEFEQLGLPFPPTSARQQALEEAIQILRGLWGDTPYTLEGATFQVREAQVRPGPMQQPHVPILIAGAGERVTLRQVAEFADASNFGPNPHTGNVLTAEAAQAKFAVLAAHCARRERPPHSILHTYWSPPVVLAETPQELEHKVAAITAPEWQFYGEHMLLGTPAEAVRHFQRLVDAGVQYFIVHTRADPDTAQLLAELVLPALIPASSGDALERIAPAS